MRRLFAARLLLVAPLFGLLAPSWTGATSIELVKDLYPGDGGPPIPIPWSAQPHDLTVTVQCAASHEIGVDVDVDVTAAGARLELISPTVSFSNGLAVGAGNQLTVINADPVPGMLITP